MSSAGAEQSLQPATNPNPPQEWISVARAWLASTFTDGRDPSVVEFEAWFDTIAASLTEDVKSTPRSQLFQLLLDAQKTASFHQEQGGAQNGTKHAKFQRTDQWQPVYSWLESLNKEEVVRSEDIAEWLEKNPAIKEDLSSKHSRYHLMHYIKKCHFKILKRRGLKKGLSGTDKPASEKIRKRKDITTRELVHFSPVPSTKVPGNDDLLLAKRNEAIQKFEILVEFEKRLMAKFPSSELTNS
ncbi:hypothetical protein QQ045_012653 [Rhodiola kirilowii]